MTLFDERFSPTQYGALSFLTLLYVFQGIKAGVDADKKKKKEKEKMEKKVEKLEAKLTLLSQKRPAIGEFGASLNTIRESINSEASIEERLISEENDNGKSK